MTLIDSFPALYDKIVPSTSSDNTFWEVEETQETASIKKIHVNPKDATILGYGDTLTKSMTQITTDRSNNLIDKECDGIAIISNNLETKLIFVDLKSKFNPDKVKDGLFQDVCSYLKMHLMCSLCDGYDVDKIKLEFIVVCKCFENNDKRTSFLDEMLQLQQMPNANPNPNIGDFYYNLTTNGLVNIEFGKLKSIKKLEKVLDLINPLIINKSIAIRLVQSETFKDCSVSFEVKI